MLRSLPLYGIAVPRSMNPGDSCGKPMSGSIAIGFDEMSLRPKIILPGRSERGNFAGPLAVAGLSVAALMTGFEITKQLLFPHISIWQSHASTIGLTVTVSTLASYFLIRRVASLNRERQAAQATMRETEERQRRVVDNLPLTFMVYELIHEPDGTPHFLYVSASVERLHGLKAEAVLQDASLLYGQIVEEDRERLVAEEAKAREAERTFSVEVRTRVVGEEVRWIHLSSTPSRLPDGSTIWDGVETDITARKREQAEREQLIGELKQALQEGTLKGILPTCSYCKRICDENGKWHQFERYIRDRSEANFSHGICPDCMRTHFRNT